jgi:hypothetical protein
MAFLVQTDAGDVAEANAYAEVDAFRAYCADRGRDVTTRTDPQCEIAIVRATDYLDTRFEFVGRKAASFQSTQWPRELAFDIDRRQLTGVPAIIKKACYELAFKALDAELMPDPTADTSGAVIAEKSEEVGPIKSSVKFAGGGAYVMPRYPAVDQLLIRAGVVIYGRRLVRA